jgi:hypothetical protein
MDWAHSLKETDQQGALFHSSLDRLTEDYEMIEAYIQSSLDRIKYVYS